MLYNKTDSVSAVFSHKITHAPACCCAAQALPRKWMHGFRCIPSALAAPCPACSPWKQVTRTPARRERRGLPGEPRAPAEGRESTCARGLLEAGPCFLSNRPRSWDKLTFSIPSCPFRLVATPLTYFSG